MFVMMSTHIMMTKGSSLHRKVRHYLKSSSWQKYVKILSWSQKHFMASKNFVMTSKRRHDFNKFVMMSKHIMTSKKSSLLQNVHQKVMSSKLPWRQNVRHDVKICCIRYDIKKLVTSKIRHGVVSKSWRQNTRHYAKKYFITPKICHGVRKFTLTSKYSSWYKHTSWWQNVRHYFKRFVKKT